MEAADLPLDSPTVSKVLSALLDLRKTYSTPYLKRTKLPKTLTDSHIKKILEQLQSTEKQCSDVIGVAQHLGSQLQSRLQETSDWGKRVDTLQRRVSELEGLTVTHESERSFSPQRSLQDGGESERLRGENEAVRSENDSLKAEVSGLKTEIRRMRREFAQCDTPKDQLKKQFFEFGLPLELQADIKSLEAKSKQQADTLTCQSLQLTEITQLCESLQSQVQTKTAGLEIALREKEDLEGRLKQAVQGSIGYEKELKEVKFELMQERFLRERLNRELRGVDIAETEVQTEGSCEEVSVQTERLERDIESQTETNTEEAACQVMVEIAEKGALAVVDIGEKSCGEAISVQHVEIQKDLVAIETLEEGEQTDAEEKVIEIKAETGEITVQTEIETRAIGTETDANGQEAESQTEAAATICTLEGCGVQGIRKSAAIAFAGSICVPCSPPQLAVETFDSGKVLAQPRQEAQTSNTSILAIETAHPIAVIPQAQSPALSLDTFAWASYAAYSPSLRLDPQISISLLSSPKPEPAHCEPVHSPVLELYTQGWADIPALPANPLRLETVLNHQYVAEVREVGLETPSKLISVDRSAVACEAKPEIHLVQTEKWDIFPVTREKEWGISVLSGELINPIVKPRTDIPDSSTLPILSLHTTHTSVLSAPRQLSLTPLPAFTLSGTVHSPSLSIESLAQANLPGLAPPDVTLHRLPVQSYLPSPRALTLSAGPACSLHPSSVSTPSLNTQESEEDWGLETCGIVNIYPEVKEEEIELFSFTICDIVPVDREEAEMTLVSQAILDLAGVAKSTPSLHLSRLPTICALPTPKPPLQLHPHLTSLSVPGQPQPPKPTLSQHTAEVLFVEGFNFRQLFIEAIEEEGKAEEGGRRRTRRRVTRKDPGEEYFTMVSCTQCLQAMKLNCPEIQAVQKADTTALYLRASEAGIPFYKVRSR